MKKGTRKANGSGTIRKRKNGKWEARYTVGHDLKGKQIQRSVYGSTQEEVRQKLTAIINSIDQKTYIEPSRTTLCDWLRYWLDEYAKDSTDTEELFRQNVASVNYENTIETAIPQTELYNIGSITMLQFARIISSLKLVAAGFKMLLLHSSRGFTKTCSEIRIFLRKRFGTFMRLFIPLFSNRLRKEYLQITRLKIAFCQGMLNRRSSHLKMMMSEHFLTK